MANDENLPVKGSVFGKSSMIDAAKLQLAMQSSAQLDPRGGADGMSFMNFTGKRGIYEVGVDKNNVDPGEAWLVNPAGFQDGWICWKGGRVMASRLYDMGMPVPTPDTNEHGPFTQDGDGWYQAKAMVLRSIDTGVQAYWKINSVSGVSTMAALQRDINQRIVSGLPYYPVVSLDKEKFTSKGYTNYKPIIKAMGWLDEPHVIQLGELFDDDDAEIDLDKMFAASAKGGNGSTAPKTIAPKEDDTPPAETVAAPAAVKRQRRAAL